MPGYILHLAEAKLICSELKKHGHSLLEQWENEFYLGCLLPDTKQKKAKVTSHFWNPDTLDRQAIPPDLHLFLGKYAPQITTPVMYGYWAHLLLDTLFVTEYWENHFFFYDKNGIPAVLEKEIETVYLKPSQKEIPLKKFFSSEYYYGDYNKMNAYIAGKYKIELPVYEPDLFCPVAEVSVMDLQNVLLELKTLALDFTASDIPNLKVFSLPDLEQFIQAAAKITADQIQNHTYSIPGKTIPN